MRSIKVSAPAKINIHLKVLGKREDGYHNLLMLNEMLELADEIEITLSDKKRRPTPFLKIIKYLLR